jgi:hypothetical protein
MKRTTLHNERPRPRYNTRRRPLAWCAGTGTLACFVALGASPAHARDGVGENGAPVRVSTNVSDASIDTTRPIVGASESTLTPPESSLGYRGGIEASPVPVRQSRVHPPALDLTATTWIPLSIGPEVSVELPGRILAQLHLGWMPGLYSSTLTSTLADAGVYEQRVGALIDGSLDSATTWRAALGWRPFPNSGLEVTVGYAHLALEGSTTTGELSPLVDEQLAERLIAEVGDTGVHLHSSIHNFTLAAAWRWLIADQVVVRASLGYMQTFDSSSSLKIDAFPELTRLAAPTVRDLLHDNYMHYGKFPVVGIAVGYRFF